MEMTTLEKARRSSIESYVKCLVVRIRIFPNV